MMRFKKTLSLIVCIVLIAAVALFTGGCDGSTDNQVNPSSDSSTGSQVNPSSDSSPSQGEKKALGQGQTKFDFTVTDGDGKETAFLISTDKETVGEALLELNLIAGDESEFGLYVKTVNGITVDYDKDGKYWAFYVDGKYAQTGVDSTKITAGSTYSFKVEK